MRLRFSKRSLALLEQPITFGALAAFDGTRADVSRATVPNPFASVIPMSDWTGIVGKSFTAETFVTYVVGLSFPAWRPQFVVVHNTGDPTLADILEVGITGGSLSFVFDAPSSQLLVSTTFMLALDARRCGNRGVEGLHIGAVERWNRRQLLPGTHEPRSCSPRSANG